MNVITHDLEYPYKGFGNCDSKCGLKIYQQPDRAIVLMTELPDNEGTSVTNCAEHLATKIREQYLADLQIQNIIWIEHYPKNKKNGNFEDTYDLVNLKWDGAEFYSPSWEPISFNPAILEMRIVG